MELALSCRSSPGRSDSAWTLQEQKLGRGLYKWRRDGGGTRFSKEMASWVKMKTPTNHRWMGLFFLLPIGFFGHSILTHGKIQTETGWGQVMLKPLVPSPRYGFKTSSWCQVIPSSNSCALWGKTGRLPSGRKTGRPFWFLGVKPRASCIFPNCLVLGG